MLNRSAIRLYGVLAVVILAATPAFAQFTPRTLNDPATGEKFHIEGAANFWMPTADMGISSEALGIIGSDIDFKNDLGLEDKRFRDLHLVLRPGRQHKFRFQYIPILYDQEATLNRRIVFNGLAYNVGLPTKSELDWKAYTFLYEYDFLVKNRGFAGFIGGVKYTDVKASIVTAANPDEGFIHARAPVPSLGGIGRVYVVPNIAITGEVTAIKIPDSLSKRYKAHYADVDIYGTLNFTNYIGLQGGYRSIDVGYHVDNDIGQFVLKGIYLGVVARY